MQESYEESIQPEDVQPKDETSKIQEMQEPQETPEVSQEKAIKEEMLEE